MEAALQALQKGNAGIDVLQETNLTGGIHTHCRSGYKVWTTEAEIIQRGRIAIFW